MKTYEEIAEEWSDLVEILRYKDDPPDVEAFKRLIFETYHFSRNNLKGDSIPRKKLELYKYICQVCESLSEEYPLEMKASLSETFQAYTMGLCYVIENGFDCGYLDNSLPSGLNRHTSAGCADPEADMTTYESFNKDFVQDVEWLIEEYEEDDC